MKILVFAHSGIAYRIPNKLYEEIVHCGKEHETFFNSHEFSENDSNRAFELLEYIKSNYKPIVIDYIFTAEFG